MFLLLKLLTFTSGHGVGVMNYLFVFLLSLSSCPDLFTSQVKTHQTVRKDRQVVAARHLLISHCHYAHTGASAQERSRDNELIIGTTFLLPQLNACL